MTDLNERQWHYLKAIFDADQEKEASIKYWQARGEWNQPPASEWRWMNYTPLTNDTLLYEKIGKEHIDPGTGSTFEALETRKLIECRYTDSGVLDKPIVWVKITSLGRKIVRAKFPDAPRPKAKGLFSEWTWRALKMAYEAGDTGIPQKDSRYGGISWNTWVILRNHKLGLVEEFVFEWAEREGRRVPRNGGIRITGAGKGFYQANLEKHRAAYPDLYEVQES